MSIQGTTPAWVQEARGEISLSGRINICGYEVLPYTYELLRCSVLPPTLTGDPLTLKSAAMHLFSIGQVKVIGGESMRV